MSDLMPMLYAILLINLTVSIRIEADCVALSCQVTRKLKRAKVLEFTAVSAIIFILCYELFCLFSILTILLFMISDKFKLYSLGSVVL